MKPFHTVHHGAIYIWSDEAVLDQWQNLQASVLGVTGVFRYRLSDIQNQIAQAVMKSHTFNEIINQGLPKRV